jgi:pimeloyl-ACP methyl ester carboxylesterase
MRSKKHYIIYTAIIVFMVSINTIIGQPYQVGHITLSFTDPARNNRNIPVEVYYPSLTAGEEVPVAPGQFPVLSFGHGFVMDVGSYANFSDFLVPEGYIFVLSNTETGFSPSHLDFGLDLAFVLHALREEGNDPESLLYGAVALQNAVMGHSMGGGASMLAAAEDTIVKAVANFAAANTTPSAILAAADITVPALLFSGSGDCVTPPSAHQEPMYDSLASACKTWINITGGGHCYFANDNFLCTFGENSCGPDLTITREEQHDATFDFLLPWLDHFLKGEQEAWEIFTDSLASSDRITYEQDCEFTRIRGENTGNSGLKVYPVPFNEYLNIEGDIEVRHLEIFDLFGRKINKYSLSGCQHTMINTSDLQPGFYQFQFTGSGGERIGLKAIKL